MACGAGIQFLAERYPEIAGVSCGKLNLRWGE